MSGEIKWIKLSTQIFSDEKIKLILAMPDGYGIFTFWIFLMTLAGKTNDLGKIYLKEGLGYSPQMLSTISNISINTVELGLKTLEEFGMIKINEDHIQILNWDMHQNVEGMEKIRAQWRARKQKQREREQKALTSGDDVSRDNHVTSRYRIREKNKNKKENKKKNIDNNIEKSQVPYEKIRELYNSICTDLPKAIKLSDARKKYIRARWKEYPDTEFWEKFMHRVQNSNFLTGKKTDFVANFDWIIKESNFIKILEGNYDNERRQQSGRDKSSGKGNDKSDWLETFKNPAGRTISDEELESIIYKSTESD